MGDKKSLKKKIEQFMNKNNLRGIIHNLDTYYVTLPYKYPQENIEHLDINLYVYEDTDLLKISFLYQISDKMSIDEIRKILLDLNTKLVYGSLALDADSNIVQFTIDYPVKQEEEIAFGTYNTYIAYCLTLYADLVERGILDKDE